MYIVLVGLKTQCKDQSLVFEVSILTMRSVGFMPSSSKHKPFNFTEMLLRIEALLRRSSRDVAAHSQPSKLQIGDLRLNRVNQGVNIGQLTLELTPIQFKLLWTLAENQGEILSKAFLYQCVLDRPFSRYDRSLDMHLSRVRKKLIEAGMPCDCLATVHGKGYRFS